MLKLIQLKITLNVCCSTKDTKWCYQKVCCSTISTENKSSFLTFQRTSQTQSKSRKELTWRSTVTCLFEFVLLLLLLTNWLTSQTNTIWCHRSSFGSRCWTCLPTFERIRRSGGKNETRLCPCRERPRTHLQQLTLRQHCASQLRRGRTASECFTRFSSG